MIKKYLAYGVIGFLIIIGWNVFLIQRDEKLYDSYAIENLKQPPNNQIR